MNIRNFISAKTRINLVLIFLWSIPLFFFVPARSSGLAWNHQFVITYQKMGYSSLYGYCFTPLPIILMYGEFAELITYDSTEETFSYMLNPQWKYWFWIVGVLLIITLYLRRDLIIKIHKSTQLPN